MRKIKLKREDFIYNFSKENKLRCTIKAGETIEIETEDCFAGQVKSEEESLSEINWDLINPATGPVYIEDAEPGDILKIEIINVEVVGDSVMVAVPGEGLFADRLKSSVTKIYKVEDNHLLFNENIKIPLKPMIGVIGTAPASGEIGNGSPGKHGGNMDCKEVVAGTTLYLPVSVKGALLSLGDLHAVMGDGEVVFCGAETKGKVTLRVTILKKEKLPLPMLENEEKIMTIASAETLDEAVKIATNNMLDYLVDNYDFSLTEAGMLLSLIGDAKICQVVDPLKTARFELKKDFNLCCGDSQKQLQ